MQIITAKQARESGILAKPKRNKFGVRVDAAGKARRTVDGILFDSVREAKHYVTLNRDRDVVELVTHPRIELSVDDQPIGYYECDFYFYDRRTSKYRYQDVKGYMTPLSKWKIRHAEIQHGITIEIIK